MASPMPLLAPVTTATFPDSPRSMVRSYRQHFSLSLSPVPPPNDRCFTLVVMESTALGSYLRARREQVRPEDVGIEASGVRRVAGLRREEVAALAGISPEYYLRLEQGRDHQPSDQVLNGLCRALRLHDDAAAYLHRLARPNAPVQVPQHVDVVDPLLVHLIEQWTTTPALIISNCQDVLAINAVAAAAPQTFAVGLNLALGVFTDAVKQTSPDWEWLASNTIAALRLAASPEDPRFVEIVEELTARDADFRRLWARHDAKPLASGPAVIMLEGFGLVPVRWQNLSVAGNSRQTITVFFGEPGTRGEAALRGGSGVPTLD